MKFLGAAIGFGALATVTKAHPDLVDCNGRSPSMTTFIPSSATVNSMGTNTYDQSVARPGGLSQDGPGAPKVASIEMFQENVEALIFVSKKGAKVTSPANTFTAKTCPESSVFSGFLSGPEFVSIEFPTDTVFPAYISVCTSAGSGLKCAQIPIDQTGLNYPSEFPKSLAEMVAFEPPPTNSPTKSPTDSPTTEPPTAPPTNKPTTVSPSTSKPSAGTLTVVAFVLATAGLAVNLL